MSRATLLALACAVLLAAVGDGMRFVRCIGSCCGVDAPALEQVVRAGCCGDEVHVAPTERVGCGCCAERPHGAGVPDGFDQKGDDDESPDCCVELTFALDPAPSADKAPVPDPGPLLFVQDFVVRVPVDACVPAYVRPFDRGPPRIDARTSLRACTVLLI